MANIDLRSADVLSFRMRRVVLTLLVVVAAVVAVVRASVAMTPCRPSQVAPLTGTLIEVREDDVVVSTEAAILKGLPRRICLRATGPTADDGAIRVVDCDFPNFEITASLAP